MIRLYTSQVRVEGAVFHGDSGYHPGKKKTFSRLGPGSHLNDDWIIHIEDRIIAMEDGQRHQFNS